MSYENSVMVNVSLWLFAIVRFGCLFHNTIEVKIRL